MGIKKVIGVALAGIITLESIACATPEEKGTSQQHTPPSISTATAIQEESTDWSFLEKRIDIAVEPLQYVLNSYVPLGPEVLHAVQTGEYHRIMGSIGSQLESQILAHGLKRSEVSFEVTGQMYGVPEDKKNAANLKRYCEIAKEFLNGELQVNEKPKILWAIINFGERYLQEYNNRGFIGNKVYTVNRIRIIKNQNNEVDFMLVSLLLEEGGRGTTYHAPDSHTLFIGSGRSAIVSPFSEILPLYTSQKTLDYSREVRAEFADQANEALTEAIAISLAKKLGKKLKIPNANNLIEEHYAALIKQPLYRYLPQARTYVEQNGAQKAFNLYMDNPAKFMSAIGVNPK